MDREAQERSRALQEGLIGPQLAEMTLELLKASLATQGWRNSDRAASIFSTILQELRHIGDVDLRPAFAAAAGGLKADLEGSEDPWPRAAADGTRYHLANIAQYGSAFGHRRDSRESFLGAVSYAQDIWPNGQRRAMPEEK